MQREGVEVAFEAFHRGAFVIDAHADLLMDVRTRRRPDVFGACERAVLSTRHLPALRAGGVDAVVFALFAEPHLREGTLRETLLMVDDLRQEIAEGEGGLYLVRTAGDLAADAPAGAVAALLSLEGTEALAGDLGILRLLHDVGLRAVGLTHFGRTMAADGTGEEEAGGGLTRFGRALVRECDRLGIMIDVSHLSERGFWDVLGLAEGPVIASHSNARALCDHPRNLTDEQLRAIARSGGAVGLNACRIFVDPIAPSLDRLLDHAAHMHGIMGPGHVGLGLDLVEYLPGWSGTAVPDLADPGQVPEITRRLLARGAPTDEITGILGENWLRVWRAVLR